MPNVELAPNMEKSEELMLPPALYHVAPLDRHKLIAEHGIIPRDDPRNPGGISGVAQKGDEYEFPGRVYLSVEPYPYMGDRVVYAVDTTMLDPRLFQVDEDNYPLGLGRNRHKPELDTPENINLALRGLPSDTPDGVSGLKRSIAYQGTIPPEALIPIKAYESDKDSIWDREIDPPTTGLEEEERREFAKKLAAISASHQRNADEPTTLGAGDL